MQMKDILDLLGSTQVEVTLIVEALMITVHPRLHASGGNSVTINQLTSALN